MNLSPIVAAVVSHPWESASTALALFAIWQSYRANRFSRMVVESEGSLNHPMLAMGLCGHPGIRQFIFLAPLESSPLLLPVPLNIRNNGSASASEIRLIVRGNKDLLPYTREWLAKNQDLSGMATATFQESDGHVNQIMYRIPILHPSMPVNIVHTAAIRAPTQVSDTISFRAADGVQVTLPYRIDFSYRLDVALFQESGPMAESFKLTILDVANRSAKEALKEYWENRAQQLGASAPSRNRWFWKWRHSPLERICVITVDKTKISPSVLIEGFREVPLQALMGAEGVEYVGGLFVPALEVSLGSFSEHHKDRGKGVQSSS